MAKKAVLKFLADQNRPFSLNDVCQNVGADHGKSAVQKAIDSLVSEEKVIEKIYGKQKVFCIVQEDDAQPEQMNDELKETDRKTNEILAKLKEQEAELSIKTTELKTLQGQMTLAEAQEEFQKLSEEIKTLESKLELFANKGKVISSETKEKVQSEHQKYLKEYKTRKRICMDMIDAIMEGYPKSKKQLYEEVGIETDDDAGFTLKQF